MFTHHNVYSTVVVVDGLCLTFIVDGFFSRDPIITQDHTLGVLEIENELLVLERKSERAAQSETNQ
jgi:hypothetical protein